jgi:hypothetical protein
LQRHSLLSRAAPVCLTLSLAWALAACGAQSVAVKSPRDTLAKAAAQAPASAAEPQPSTPPFFAADSIWNAPLSEHSALDPESPRLVGAMNAVVQSEVAAKFGPWISTTGYTTTIYTVPENQRTVRVALRNNNPALQRAFSAVPLPADAQPSSGSDAQLTVWQPGHDKLWEFWRLGKSSTGWHAQWGGAMRHVSSSPGYFTPSSWPGARSNWGATATSLPLVGGLVTLADLKRGSIDHALALGFPLTQAGVFRFPAQRTDGKSRGVDAVPEGTRFRLDPQLNLSSLDLPPLTAMIARAAQRYGIIVRDTSGVVDFYGQDSGSSKSGPFAALFEGQRPWQLLARFPWADLQALARQHAQ